MTGQVASPSTMGLMSDIPNRVQLSGREVSLRAARFFAVIVLHKLAAQESLSVRTLLASASEVSEERMQLQVLLYDNSPQISPAMDLPHWIRYEKAPCNLGLAAAYNRALAMALREGYEWLLTLDQDTELPAGYLERMSEIAVSLECAPHVAAIVPQLVGDGKMLSPLCFRCGAFPRWYAPGFVGVPDERVFAFNSGAVLRVSALRQAGGYDPRFWLDYSDTRLFCLLAKYGKRVFVAGDMRVRHNFSMLDKEKRMPVARYRELLSAEAALWAMEMNWLAGMERTIRLAVRYVRHVLHGDRPEFRRETLQSLFTRLFRTGKWRILEWQRQLSQSHPDIPTDVEDRPAGLRPKVSVCMATFNGEKYVVSQLESILCQLEEGDEVVVVDDGSSDRTVELISLLQDSRLLLIRHVANQGVVASFEDAVRSATGDILFLSDQDDLWARDRVDRTLKAFSGHPRASVVVTNMSLIDEAGSWLTTDANMSLHPFDSRLIPNLIANRFQGSAMALRSQVLPQVLPFPKKKLFLHDAWVGARCAWLGLETRYLSEPLLYYRRHGSNVSTRLSLARMVLKRLELLGMLLLDATVRRFR